MSIIHEALKKAQDDLKKHEEAEQKTKEEIIENSTVDEIKNINPDDSIDEQSSKTSSQITVKVSTWNVVIFFILLLVTGLALIHFFIQPIFPFNAKKQTEINSNTTIIATQNSASSPVSNQNSVAEKVETEMTISKVTEQPSETNAQASNKTESKPAEAIKPPEKQSTKTTANNAAAPVLTRPLNSAQEKYPELRKIGDLPSTEGVPEDKLKLNGVTIIKGQRIALINNQIYKMGDVVEGKKIITIDREKVELMDDEYIVTLSVRNKTKTYRKLGDPNYRVQ